MAVASKTPASMSSVQTSAKDTTNAIAAAAVASVGVPTKPEFDAVVALVNDLRTIAINAGLA